MPTFIGARPKGFPNAVWRNDERASGAAMEEGRIDGPAQIVKRRHIADGVVYEHSIELATVAQAERSHVALVVRAFQETDPPRSS